MNQDDFSPGCGFRLGGIDSEDMKISNRSGLLEEFEARLEISPRLQLPPWGINSKDMKNLQQVRLLEEFKAG